MADQTALLAEEHQTAALLAEEQQQEQQEEELDSNNNEEIVILSPLNINDSNVTALRNDLKEGKWETTKEFLLNLQSNNERQYYIWALTEDWEDNGPPHEALEAWITAGPTPPITIDDECATTSLGYLLRGEFYTKWAWQARSAHYAEHVQEEAWELFVERLEKAMEDFEIAATLANAEDPLVYALSIKTAMGLQKELEEIYELFEAAIALWPTCPIAHTSMLNCLCAKWLGSHDLMLQFARSVTSRSPEGSPLWVLIAQAHIEGWLALLGDYGHAAGYRYFQRQDVRDELLHAYQMSLGSPLYQETCLTHLESNWFAFALTRMESYAEARHEFNRIGSTPTKLPWCYSRDAVETFRRNRDTAFDPPTTRSKKCCRDFFELFWDILSDYA